VLKWDLKRILNAAAARLVDMDKIKIVQIPMPKLVLVEPYLIFDNTHNFTLETSQT
jgi:hypothetical protein